jgi:hypothetical protein
MRPLLPNHVSQTVRLDSTEEYVGVNVLPYSATFQAVKSVCRVVQASDEPVDGTVREDKGNRIVEGDGGEKVPIEP